MTTWRFETDRDELLTVGDVLATWRPNELEGEGVWVRSVDGQRVWSVRSGDVLWEVTGAAVSEPLDPRCLPDRLIWNARQLVAREGGGDVPVTIEIPDDLVAIARADDARCVVDLPRQSVVPRMPMYYEHGATATLTVGRLLELVRRAFIAPTGFDGPGPTAFLLIRDDEVSISVDWAPLGAFRTTQVCAAATTGDHHRAIRVSHLSELIQYLDEDDEITIVLPKFDHVPYTIVGPHYRMAFDKVVYGVRRYAERLERELETASNGACRALDESQFVVSIGERCVYVALVDDPDEAIRLTTEVCVGVEATPELLTEINRANAAMHTVRLWHENGVVWARSEVPIAAIDDIGTVLRNLDDQVRGFDVFLGSFGIGA